jgi:hypothetical protein
MRDAAHRARHRRIENPTPDDRVRGGILRCQVRIDVARRAYSEREAEGCAVVLGARASWARAPQSLLWTNATLSIPPFDARTQIDLHLACSYDFTLGITKYLHALEGGEIPLTLFFTGTLFRERDSVLRAVPIASTDLVTFALPHHVYTDAIAGDAPNAIPLALRRDIFDRLLRYRARHGVASWEHAIERLLDREMP